MRVEAVALKDFIHGDISATEGHVVRHRNGNLLDDGFARGLERAGLVRIRTTPAKDSSVGKVKDDGAGQPSSSSPVAPASQKTTSEPLKRGPGRPRKADE